MFETKAGGLCLVPRLGYGGAVLMDISKVFDILIMIY